METNSHSCPCLTPALHLLPLTLGSLTFISAPYLLRPCCSIYDYYELPPTPHSPGVCFKVTPIVSLASVKYRRPPVLQRFLSTVAIGPRRRDQWRDRIACRRVVRGSVDTQLMNNWAAHYVTAIRRRRIDRALFRCDVHPASTHTDSSELIHVLPDVIFSLFLLGGGGAVGRSRGVSWKEEWNSWIYRQLKRKTDSRRPRFFPPRSSTNFPFLLPPNPHSLLFSHTSRCLPAFAFCRLTWKGVIIISSFPVFSLFNATLLLVPMLISHHPVFLLSPSPFIRAGAPVISTFQGGSLCPWQRANFDLKHSACLGAINATV